MTTIRELVTIWKFDIDAKPLKNLEAGLENIKTGVIAIGALTVTAGAALFGLAKVTADAGTEISVTADKVGLSTDALQEYRFVAKQAGIETSKMDSLFFNLNKTIGEARQGFGSGRDGLELLSRETGILLDLTGSMDEQFQTIVDSLGQIKDEAKRAAIAEKFFGGEGRQLATIIGLGSGEINKFRQSFRDLGGVMSKEAIKASKDFIKVQAEILTIITGVRNEIASEVLPVIIELGKKIKEWFKVNKELIKQNLKKFIKGLITVFKDTVKLLSKMFEFVDKLVKLFGGWEKAAKLVLTVFTAIMALKIASGFGSMVLAGFQFIGVLQQMGAAALLLQVKLFLIPIAITAIIAALALVAEDFVAFSEGRDSVIGRLIKGFDEFIDGLSGKFKIIGVLIKGFLGILLTPIRAVVNGIRSIGEIIDIISGKTEFLKGLQNIGKRALSTLSFGLAGEGGAGLLGLENIQKNVSATEKAALGGGPPLMGLGASTTTTNNNTNGSFEINVMGLPPEDARLAAQDAFLDIFNSTLRGAQRDTTPQVER